MYQQTPWIVLSYPATLEAVNTAKWTGWTQLWGTGPAWQCEGNLTSHFKLRPAVLTSASTASGGSNTTLIAVVVVVVIIAAGTVFVFVRRRRRLEDEA